ncbi:argininosuccinate lyase [Lewinellaceae bacterium SD302]|nr:argininosuccinate lyase [Lewinellaceae bacterium SD302]
MKLWQKETTVDALIETFTIGNDPDFDLQLARYDVQGTSAHIKMLTSIGLLTEAELQQLEAGLEAIAAVIEAGEFKIEPGVEDVHSQVELLLTRKLGEVGKKIHSGRSRNDQVLVDLRLFFRAEIREIASLLDALFATLLANSERYQGVLMPGYTHTQVAMVSSFGLWFGGYAEALVDDLALLQSVHKINNQNPLGSAAGYGSSFPLDRKLTTELLGFDDLAYNSINAQLGRGKTEQFISFALAGISSTLGKLAADIVLFSNENYRFLTLPDAFTTGSSIMPHKKNPDVFELIRGHCNLLQSLPAQVSMLNANLISGYHRDYQLLKQAIFPALANLKNCLRLTERSLQELRVSPDILADEKYRYLYTVEAVNERVLAGTPFREAYQQVGAQIEAGKFTYDGELHHTHEGSIGNLCLEEIRGKFERQLKGFGGGI